MYVKTILAKSEMMLFVAVNFPRFDGSTKEISQPILIGDQTEVSERATRIIAKSKTDDDSFRSNSGIR